MDSTLCQPALLLALDLDQLITGIDHQGDPPLDPAEITGGNFDGNHVANCLFTH